MISNTFRHSDGHVTRRLFSIEEYNSEKEMIYAWCSFLRTCDPDVLINHNILGFDLPFLQRRAGSLPIGRGSEVAVFAKNPSRCRKDQSQSYDYHDVLVRGREIVDTFHLAIKYDVAANYKTYRLKDIVKQEGLERQDREHFNFTDKSTKKIYEEFLAGNNEQWERFKIYAEHDADDSLALFDLMIPPYFYFCQSVPKTLQQVVSSGRSTGNQINAFLIRSYLAEKHSIPKGSDVEHFQGADSSGTPGIHKYVGKVDVASLYPSIILEYKIYDKIKDPKGNFLKMVEFFTEERLRNKKLARDTNDRKFKDLEQAQKIIINSAYGFMGAPGLNFNSPANAALVTRHGRDILAKGIKWAEDKGWTIVNSDTDSFSFTTGGRFDSGMFRMWIDELNSLFPAKIRWEDDGTYTTFVVLKIKNYIMQDEKTGKLKIKGSCLKATNKERALQNFINETINLLITDNKSAVVTLYNNMALSCFGVNEKNISEWVTKKAVTKNVMTKDRANERKVREAYEREGLSVQEGDKIFTYFKKDGSLGIMEKFDGDYDPKRLLAKLHATAKVFENIIPLTEFKKFQNKKEYIQIEEQTKQMEML
jgi:DNA polymerase elongation subunit (family B)